MDVSDQLIIQPPKSIKRFQTDKPDLITLVKHDRLNGAHVQIHVLSSCSHKFIFGKKLHYTMMESILQIPLIF